VQPKDFLLYYSAIFVLAVILIMRRKPRKGMLLKLRGKGGPKAAGGRDYAQAPAGLAGSVSSGSVSAVGERPLNVVFNYNGHSWDAYEVLGLPAGSSLERVEEAYRESLQRVDAGSKPFIEAAFAAIQSQWKTYKISGNS